jgi:hypothetical protein
MEITRSVARLPKIDFVRTLVPLAICLLLMTPSVGMTTNKGADIGHEASDQTTIVIAGEVMGITSKWEGALIYSYVTVAVREVRSGSGVSSGAEITVKHIGGEVNGSVLWQSDEPYFRVGELVQLNLRQTDSIFVVVGGLLGKTPLDSELQPVEVGTIAGYRLSWFHPSYGWSDETNRPGPDWYGPLQWESMPVTYYVDTRNMPPDSVTYVNMAYQTWEDDPDSNMDYAYGGTRTDVEPGVRDAVNLFGWRDIDGPGNYLGVTRSWALTGPEYSLHMVDSDIWLDTSDSWSTAETCPALHYDVQNIATHEVGHSVGLADLYDLQDQDMTMYGVADFCEMKKRSLEWGDQVGVHALYPLYPLTLTITLIAPADGTVLTQSSVRLEAKVTGNPPIPAPDIFTFYVDGNVGCPIVICYGCTCHCDLNLAQRGHTYTWHATGWKIGYIAATSPAWTFTYQPPMPVVTMKSKTIFHDEFSGVRVKVEWRESGHRRRTTLTTPFSVELLGLYKFTAPSSTYVNGGKQYFERWEDESGGVLTTSKSLTYDVQSGKTFYAVYGPKQYKLTVYVKDIGTRKPVVGATVEVTGDYPNQHFILTTNSRGKVIFNGICARQWLTVTITKDGCQPFTVRIFFTRNTTYRAYLTPA